MAVAVAVGLPEVGFSLASERLDQGVIESCTAAGSRCRHADAVNGSPARLTPHNTHLRASEPSHCCAPSVPPACKLVHYALARKCTPADLRHRVTSDTVIAARSRSPVPPYGALCVFVCVCVRVCQWCSRRPLSSAAGPLSSAGADIAPCLPQVVPLSSAGADIAPCACRRWCPPWTLPPPCSVAPLS